MSVQESTETRQERRERARFGRVGPCKKCPFRTDVEPYLRPGRTREIAENIREGGDFACHETTVSVVNDSGEEQLVDLPGVSQMCAGALITLEKSGEYPQNLRIAERLGFYDPTRLKMGSPVYDSLTEWVRSYSPVQTVTTADGEVLEFEHCAVVDSDCEDPPGYAGGSGAYGNPEDPTCDPTVCCQFCGRTMCVSCRSEDVDGLPCCTLCATDVEEDDEESFALMGGSPEGQV